MRRSEKLLIKEAFSAARKKGVPMDLCVHRSGLGGFVVTPKELKRSEIVVRLRRVEGANSCKGQLGDIAVSDILVVCGRIKGWRGRERTCW